MLKAIREIADHKPVVSISLLLISIPLIHGCSSGTHVSGAWQPPEPAALPYEHILIVGITSNGRARRIAERRMAIEISDAGTKATASYHVERKIGEQPLSREHVIAMAGEAGADAVLVTRMLHQDTVAGKTKSEAYVDVGPQVVIIEHEHTTEVWAGNYSIHQTPAELMVVSDLFLESAVYDIADGGRVVYIISIESKFKEDANTSVEDAADDIADGIVRQVRKAGIVR